MQENGKVDAQSVRLIRERIGNRLRRAGTELATDPLSEPQLDQLAELSGAALDSFSHIGRMPPSPPTIRGHLGRYMVGIVRHLLAWYTPQIIAFNGLIAEVIRAQTAAIVSLRRSVSEAERETTIVSEQLLIALAAVDRLAAEVERRQPTAKNLEQDAASEQDTTCVERTPNLAFPDGRPVDTQDQPNGRG